MKQDVTTRDHLVDIYDLRHEIIGQKLKSEAHLQGLWHNVFHCWILAGDKIWLQLRSKDKALFPNFLDISAAGHVEAGERIINSCIREVYEELGIRVAKDDLCGEFVFLAASNWEKIQNREFAYVYFCETYLELTDVNYNRDEVDAVLEVSIKDFIDLIEEKEQHIPATKYVDSRLELVSIDRASLAPHDKGYYYTLVSALKSNIDL